MVKNTLNNLEKLKNKKPYSLWSEPKDTEHHLHNKTGKRTNHFTETQSKKSEVYLFICINKASPP